MLKRTTLWALVLLLPFVLTGCFGPTGSSLDKTEVEAVLHMYAFYLEKLNVDGMMSLYHLPVKFINDVLGTEQTYSNPSTLRDVLATGAAYYENIEAVQLTTPTITGSGSSATARVTALIKAKVVQVPTPVEVVVTYEFGLEKISGQWKIRSERLISSTLPSI